VFPRAIYFNITEPLTLPGREGEGEESESSAGKGKEKEEGKKKTVEETQKEWEANQRSKGMPTEGLNTFRIKKN